MALTPNVIKFSTSSLSNATLVGSVLYGWGGINYGQSSNTGWYNGVTPPSGGYVIYATSASQIISATVANNDSDLIIIGNQFTGQNFTSSAQAQTYLNANGFSVVNQVYTASASIITGSLSLYLDASNSLSYPGSGSVWKSLVNGYSGSLGAGNGYTSSYGGAITFNGGASAFVNMSGSGGNAGSLANTANNISIEAWYQSNNNFPGIVRTGLSSRGFVFGYFTGTGTQWKVTKYGVTDLQAGAIPQNTLWHQAVLTYSSTTGTRVYIDGVLTSPTSSNVQSISPGNELSIGKSENVFLNGNMAIFRWYDTVLSASDVLQNFNADKGRFGL